VAAVAIVTVAAAKAAAAAALAAFFLLPFEDEEEDLEIVATRVVATTGSCLTTALDVVTCAVTGTGTYTGACTLKTGTVVNTGAVRTTVIAGGGGATVVVTTVVGAVVVVELGVATTIPDTTGAVEVTGGGMVAVGSATGGRDDIVFCLYV